MPSPDIPHTPGSEPAPPTADTAHQHPAADPGTTASKKPSLAFVLDQRSRDTQQAQHFPQSFGTPPCKPPRSDQPTAYMAVLGLCIALLLGVGVYAVVKQVADLHKPRVPPKHMPMRIMEGGGSTQALPVHSLAPAVEQPVLTSTNT